MRRRSFVKFSALASASILVPDFLKAFGNHYRELPGNGRTLVVIQLSGGNDGLNCVVPYRNDLYYKARPTLGLKREELHVLNDETGLHENLESLADLFHDGKLGILHGVGYPNPNRSHFRSTDIWQAACGENENATSGWIGRYLDAQCEGSCPRPHAAVEIDDTLSLALKGNKMKGLAFRNPQTLQQFFQNPVLRNTAESYRHSHGNPAAEYLNKTLAETYESAGYIYDHSKIFRSKRLYPQHEFGQHLKTIAELIASGSETRVYYISLSGFDTHAFQLGQQSRILKVYSEAMKSFCADLADANRFHETVILTFSEFGRRVEQNASKGTDHGAANNVFIAGGNLARSGLLNPLPDLGKLDQGDLVHSVDFRQVYATLLVKWLQADASEILNGNYPLLNFI